LPPPRVDATIRQKTHRTIVPSAYFAQAELDRRAK